MTGWPAGPIALLLALGPPLGAIGCAGASSSNGSSGGFDAGADSGWNSGAGSGSGGATGGGPTTGGDAGIATDAGPVLPPEAEVESSYEAPVATGRYVWIANPASGRVAFVDAATLTVQTAEAGNAPTYVAAVPGATDAVIVLNVLSHDASFLKATASGLQAVMIPHVAARANAWAVSDDGRWALAWSDVRRIPATDKSVADKLEGFQDVTVIDLAASPPTATTVAVGYRPVSVAFSRDGRRAFAVTQDGVSVIALPGASGAVEVVRDVPLTEDLNESADTRDVSISSAVAGTSRAIVRHEGSVVVRVVDLDTGVQTTLSLSGPVTDLDVTHDGTRAIAVVRDTGDVVIIPLDGATVDPAAALHTTITGETIGQVVLAPDDRTAILYSNATESERLVVLDLSTAAYRVLRTHAPVLSVFPTPDAKFGVVLHRDVAGAGGATGTSGSSGAGGAAGFGGVGGVGGGFGTSGTTGSGGATGTGGASSSATPTPALAFSVIPLDGSRSGRIQGTEALPRSVGISSASDRALITVRDDRLQAYAVYVARMPTLEIERVALASPPLAAGVVAGAARGYVQQSHPEGRITFIPFDGTSPRTLTGFELGARVVDGVSP